MKFVKTRDGATQHALAGIFLGILFLFIVIGLPLTIVAFELKARGNSEAPLEDYRLVAAMSEELPELRDEIRLLKEDGILSRNEVKAISKRAEQIRKIRELEKIK